MGRTIFRLLALLLVVAVLGSVGAAVYNAGVNAGLDEAARLAATSGEPGAVIYPYGAYYHGPWGFGFFGIFFAILGIFIVFGLLRAAFGWGRWRGRGPGNGWGHGGPGWGGPGGRGPGSRREMVEDWHRELHRRDSAGGEATAEPPGVGA